VDAREEFGCAQPCQCIERFGGRAGRVVEASPIVEDRAGQRGVPYPDEGPLGGGGEAPATVVDDARKGFFVSVVREQFAGKVGARVVRLVCGFEGTQRRTLRLAEGGDGEVFEEFFEEFDGFHLVGMLEGAQDREHMGGVTSRSEAPQGPEAHHG